MNIILLLKIILISIVQGITEWLPVSSTGHMILLEEFLNLNVRDEFWEIFLVVVQLGSILAVVILFFNKINPFSRKKTKEENKNTLNMWFKIAIAIIPSAIVGILFDDILNDLFYNYITVAATLIIYGIAFILIENKNKDRLIRIDHVNKIDYKTALLIGCFQMLALIPGTSRSGSTIIGGMLLGLSRTVAAEFSFFMAIPVMLGASLVKFYKYGFSFTNDEIILLSVGVVVAFVVSLFAIKFLMNFIKKHSFKEFGYYRIGLGVIVIAYFIAITLNQ